MAFNNYDPDHYDPNNFTGDAPVVNGGGTTSTQVGDVTTMAGSQLAQLDLSINNATAANLKAELFSYLWNYVNVSRPDLTTFLPASWADVAAANMNNRIYFNANGDQVIQDNAGAQMTISCRQEPYRSLFNSSEVTPFMIEKIRMTIQDDGQMDNEIHIEYRSFLNKTEANSINPRTFFNAYQQQSKIIDIPLKTLIDPERGLWVTVNAGQTLNIAIFISKYKKMTLR